MKYLLFILLALNFKAVAQQASTPKFNTGVQYNEYIIDRQIKVANAINSFTVSMDSGSVAYSTIQLEKLSKTCKHTLADIKLMPPYKGNQTFRDAAIKLFEFYCQVSQVEYKQLMEFALKPNVKKEDLDKMQPIMDKVTTDEQLLDGAFLDEQTKFAVANNFTLEKKKNN